MFKSTKLFLDHNSYYSPHRNTLRHAPTTIIIANATEKFSMVTVIIGYPNRSRGK